MTINLKLKQGAEEYQRKLKLGEVKPLDPFEKAKLNSNSLRMAINAYCYDCCCEQKPEVRLCPASGCSFHHLRPWQPRKI